MSIITEVPAPILDALRHHAAFEVEMAADNLCSGTTHIDDLETGNDRAMRNLARMEDVIVDYRRIMAAAPYEAAALVALASRCIESEAAEDRCWPTTADGDDGGLADHLALIALRDEWQGMADAGKVTA